MPPTVANGKICYVEIPAVDVPRSIAFYEAVFGWQTRRRGDGSTAFDDGVGQVSGTWVAGRPSSGQPGLLIYIMVDDIAATADPDRPGVRVAGRRVAHVGVAVRNWVACFGLVLNVDPDLGPFRDVRCDGDPVPMTSLQRETPARVRASGVRQRLVELVADRFGFDRVSPFHTHPGLSPRPSHHAAVTRSR